MERRKIVVVSLTIAMLLLSACTPEATPQAAAPATAPRVAPTAVAPMPAVVPAAPARTAWEIAWDKTVEAAKKEQRLVLYVSFGGEARQVLTSAFTNRYGVHVESMTGGTGDLGTKIFAEQRAGIYSSDVWVGGSTTYRELKDTLDSPEPALILPDLTEPELIKKTWYFGELPWANKARSMLIALMDYQLPISTNTNLVKAGEIKSYHDLLDPKWKGKISLQDPRVGGMGQMWFAVVLELGDVDVNYIRELVTKQDLFITRDRRLQAEWLARAKHAIAIAPHTGSLAEFIGMGLPIDRFNLGTPFMSGGAGSGIGLMAKAPHPNAAKLFINWLLSQEGATVHSRAIGIQSQRLDVPTDHLLPAKILGPGVKVYRSDNEEFATKRESVYAPLAKEILGP